MAKIQLRKFEKPICLNPNVGELIEYLQLFPADAPVTIHADYKDWECQVCSNFDYQEATGRAQLMQGLLYQAD